MSNKIKALIMLDNENTDLNPFPIDVFPALFKDLAIEYHKSQNFPLDYTGTSMLVAISTVMGTSIKFEVTIIWHEYASLYCCVIGNAGANKSHPISAVFDPLRHIDSINHRTFEKQYNAFQEYEKLTTTEKKKATKVDEPILKKHILTNFTPEALSKRINENPRGCTIVSDEIVTHFENINNYSKGDQIGNYLSIWNHKPTTVDRVSVPIPIYIDTPFLSIIGGLQPRMLGSAFPIQKTNNGFYQRFLFAYPDSTRKMPLSFNIMDKSLIDEYSKFIINYINENNVVKNNGVLNSRTLNWTDEARNFFIEWQKQNCDKVNENNDTIKGEILSKYDNHFIRLAMILQFMENTKSCTIELKAVEGAEKLCNYYINCSFKVLGILQDPATYLKSLPQNKINFYDALPNEFSTAEAIKFGLAHELAERRTKEFLKDEILFINTKHGAYKKKSIQKK